MKKLFIAVCFIVSLSSVLCAETYNEYHKRLTDCFYNKKPFNGKILTKAQFERLHNANWKALENYRLKNKKGYAKAKAQEEQEQKINIEVQRLMREQAIKNLRERGEIQ